MRRTTVATMLSLTVLSAACGGDGRDPAEGSRPAPAEVDTVAAADDQPAAVESEVPPTEEPASGEELEPGPVPTEPVKVVTDIPYYGAGTDEARFLDVYHPDGGSGLPLVVLFHTNPVFGGTKRSAEPLARLITERGAVVVTPTYGSRVFEPTDVLRWFRDEGPCAVWNAVALGPAYGADPSRVVLVGETTGIFPAQMATFSPPARIAECEAPATDVSIDASVLFETDWLVVPDFWDDVFAADPGYFAAITHWDDLADPPPTRIHILAGEIEDHGTTRSMEGRSYAESDWIGLRDPDRALADAFAASGLLEDGIMSFQDVARITVDTLVAAGWNAELTIVPGVGHTLSGDEARELVADLVFEADAG